MGNSNIEPPVIKEWEIAVFRYSPFYGRHQLKDNLVVKKYELVEEGQRDAFLGLIQSYKKIEHPALIKIQNVRLTNNAHCYQVDFGYFPINLAMEIKERRESNPYSQQQIAKLLLRLFQIVAIFQEKQFPFGSLSLQKIAVMAPQTYCVGLQILMNTNTANSKQSNLFLSPQEKQISKYPHGFNVIKSTIFSIGLIALSTIVHDLQLSNLQPQLFQLRQHYSYQFCNLLKSMLILDNCDRASLEQCMEACRDLLQKRNCNGEFKQHSFIRGYNCIESLWLLEERREEAVSQKWRLRARQKGT